jgi:hypothetical protein
MVMSKSHSRRSQHVQPEKPAAPPPPDQELSPPRAEGLARDEGWRPGMRVALTVWLAGFIALLAWLVIDLLMGLWRQ